MGKNLLFFLKLCRLKFLIYSPIMYSIGAAIAKVENNQINSMVFIYGLLFVWIAHATTHFFNEYYDYEADLKNLHPSPWTGGSRVLVEGHILRINSLYLGYSTLLIMCLCLMMFTKGLVLLIGFSIIILSVGYSAPPLKLEYRGMGELDVALVLNILVPLWGYALQSSIFSKTYLLLFLLVPAVIEYARMMVMNMPDRHSDLLAGKRTLIVRIGMRKAVRIYCSLNIAAYVSSLIFWQKIPYLIILLFLLTSPLSIWLMWRLQKGDWKKRKTFYTTPFWASLHNGLVSAAFLLGIILSYIPQFSFKLESFSLYLYVGATAYFSFCIYQIKKGGISR